LGEGRLRPLLATPLAHPIGPSIRLAPWVGPGAGHWLHSLAERLRMPTPTLNLPRPAIHIEGVPRPALTEDLLAFTIEDTMSAPARCTARFRNLGVLDGGAVGYRYFGLEEFDFGEHLTVWQGVPPDTLFRLFHGRIHLIEGSFGAGTPPEIVLQAEDALQELRMRQRTRIFRQMSDGMIIHEIAAEHGLTPQIDGGGVETVHQQVAQLNQSDLAFLLDRLAASGMGMWIDGNMLVVAGQGPSAEPDVLVYGEGLLDFQVRADLRRQATVFGVSGWNIQTKQPIAGGASDGDLPTGSGGDRSGGRVLETAFGQRLETVVDAAPATSQEAKSLAVALHRARSAEFITGQGTAVPSPGLRVGRTVRLEGVGPLFDGTYQITTVRHLYHPKTGLRTEFEVRRPRIGRSIPTQKSKEASDAHRDRGAAGAAGAGPLPATPGAPRKPRKR